MFPMMMMPMCSPVMPMGNFAGFSGAPSAGSGAMGGALSKVFVASEMSNLSAFYNDVKNKNVLDMKA